MNLSNKSLSSLTAKFVYPDLLFTVSLPSGQIERITGRNTTATKQNLWGDCFHHAFTNCLDLQEMENLFKRLPFGAIVDVLAWIENKPAFLRFESNPKVNKRDPHRTATIALAYISNDDACALFDHDKKILTLSSCWEWEIEEEPVEALLCS